MSVTLVVMEIRGIEKICVILWFVFSSLDYTHTHTLPIHTSSQLDSLKRLHPLLSRDGVWLERKKKEIEATFLSQNKFSPHETAIEDCKRRGLSQGAYFLQRDLYFCREVTTRISVAMATK